MNFHYSIIGTGTKPEALEHFIKQIIYSISTIIDRYHITSLLISFGNNIITSGRENRVGDTSSSDNDFKIMLGNSQKEFGKKRKKKVKDTHK